MTNVAAVANWTVNVTKWLDSDCPDEPLYNVTFTERRDWSPQTFSLDGLDYEQVESLAAALYVLLDNA